MSGLRQTTEGVLIETPIDGSKSTSFATYTCCHCGRVWIPKPGSGITRGFCTRCGARTCGDPACDVCVPLEQQLLNLEHGRHILTPAPVCVAIPRKIGG